MERQKGVSMIFILAAIAILAVDLRIKNYIEENKQHSCEEKILGGTVIIRKYHNTGAFLNFMQKKKQTVLLLSSVLLFVAGGAFLSLLRKKGHTLEKAGLSMLLGGAASNVWDRISRGYVVDYFSFRWLKKVVFNLGDLFIFFGGLMTLLGELKKR